MHQLHIMFLLKIDVNAEYNYAPIKVYFRLLFITVTIQIVGFLITYAIDFLLSKAEIKSFVHVFIGLICIVISIIIAGILSIKWCNNKYTALIINLLLPTNYTWLFVVVMVIRFVGNILDIFKNIPKNFG